MQFHEKAASLACSSKSNMSDFSSVIICQNAAEILYILPIPSPRIFKKWVLQRPWFNSLYQWGIQWSLVWFGAIAFNCVLKHYRIFAPIAFAPILTQWKRKQCPGVITNHASRTAGLHGDADLSREMLPLRMEQGPIEQKGYWWRDIQGPM